MIQTIILIFLGICTGVLTGLVPGLHINLVALITISTIPIVPLISQTNPLSIVLFIVSMSVTHTFLDFIPSIYLGAPDEDSFLSVLPGHKLLKEGRGHFAVLQTLIGSLIAIPIILLFVPLFILFTPSIDKIIRPLLPYLLIFISLFLIFKQKEIILSTIIFLLAGFIGFAALNLPIKEPLFPLLTGLFGVSTLAISLQNKNKLEKQKIDSLRSAIPEKSNLIKSGIAAIISAPLCSFLPGIGSGHAALIGSEIIPQNNPSFLILVGAINTIVISLSFITLYTIQKSRTGVASAISQITNNLTITEVGYITLTIIFVGITAFIIGIKISKLFALVLNRINYKYLTISILTFLMIMSLIISNPLGFLVLITSSALGIFTITSGVKRINLMGCLIVPTILFYLL